jgi:hypothetical protein
MFPTQEDLNNKMIEVNSVFQEVFSQIDALTAELEKLKAVPAKAPVKKVVKKVLDKAA